MFSLPYMYCFLSLDAKKLHKQPTKPNLKEMKKKHKSNQWVFFVSFHSKETGNFLATLLNVYFFFYFFIFFPLQWFLW